MENNPYDVVLLDQDRCVVSIPMTRCHLKYGYHSAQRWRNTYTLRHPGMTVEIVESGKFKIGDTVKKENLDV